jgi:hypothetical protein
MIPKSGNRFSAKIMRSFMGECLVAEEGLEPPTYGL